MKRVIWIEMAWLVGLFVIAFLITALIVSNQALDISAHDTYNLDGSKFSPWWRLLLTFFIISAYAAYLIRAIFLRFKVLRVCIILFIFTSLVLGTIEYADYSFRSFFSKVYWYNSSDASVKGLFYGGDMSENRFLLCLRIFLIITLAFTSFMMGRCYKLKK